MKIHSSEFKNLLISGFKCLYCNGSCNYIKSNRIEYQDWSCYSCKEYFLIDKNKVQFSCSNYIIKIPHNSNNVILKIYSSLQEEIIAFSHFEMDFFDKELMLKKFDKWIILM